LECFEGRFEIPNELEVRSTKRLRKSNDTDLKKSLYDYVPDDINEYEKSIALYLDAHPQVLWWYRNLVGHKYFGIQGYKRNRVYPDFVAQKRVAQDEFPFATVLVVESKGKHLAGNLDTEYKKDLADRFEEVGREVYWQHLAEGFHKNHFRFQVIDEGDYSHRGWQETLEKFLGK
jgi:type III restriction enzyme